MGLLLKLALRATVFQIAFWGLMLTAPLVGHTNDWTESELALMKSLTLGNSSSDILSPSNKFVTDERAATFGHQLFFDTRFSANGAVSCASCHEPKNLFIDGLPLATGGLATTDRKTMTIIGASASPWLFWDGRKDSLWSQALGPWENSVEHGGNRAQYARLIGKHYSAVYQSLFGPLPDLADLDRFPFDASPESKIPSEKFAWESMTPEDQDTISRIFANMGKAVEAYQRQFMPARSKFDIYVEKILDRSGAAPEETIFSQQEEDGLRLFLSEDKGRCIQCHNGPLFTNNEFHNTGVPPRKGRSPDRGRAEGVELVLTDEFNCLSRFSDADPQDCQALRFVKKKGPELEGAMRTPALRNIAQLGPFMHQGQFATLREVLLHYRDAPQSKLGHTELKPLDLNDRQLASIESFLRTLDGGMTASEFLLEPPQLP